MWLQQGKTLRSGRDTGTAKVTTDLFLPWALNPNTTQFLCIHWLTNWELCQTFVTTWERRGCLDRSESVRPMLAATGGTLRSSFDGMLKVLDLTSPHLVVGTVEDHWRGPSSHSTACFYKTPRVQGILYLKCACWLSNLTSRQSLWEMVGGSFNKQCWETGQPCLQLWETKQELQPITKCTPNGFHS